MNKEIERKWLPNSLQIRSEFIDLIKRLATEKVLIKQRYFHEENPMHNVGRVRQYATVTEACLGAGRRTKVIKSEITLKGGKGLERTEINIPVGSDLAAELLVPNPDVVLIEKIRYVIPLPSEGLEIEVDVYEGDNRGLIHIEVEFPDTNTAKNFVPLPWFGEDVTDEIRHTNSELQEHPYTWWEGKS